MSYTITSACTGCTACTRRCPVIAISGERKHPHRIDPRKCIDCGACGKICASQAILDEHGRATLRVRPEQWRKPVWNYRACVECRICVITCPTSSINLIRYHEHRNGLKLSYPFLQHAKTCISCGFCKDKCPASAIDLQHPVEPIAMA